VQAKGNDVARRLLVTMTTAMLPVAGIAVAQDARERPAVAVHPEEWLGPNHYPPAALRSGEQGRVIVFVDVDAAGRPRSCRPQDPGVLPVLADGTCRAVLNGGRFEPARDRKGHPVASTTTLPVRWVIPVSPSGPLPATPVGPMEFTSVLSYAADDRLLSCDVRMDGRPLSMPAGTCGPFSTLDPTKLREVMKLVGPFRTAQIVTTRYGATPPPPPPSPLSGEELLTVAVRQHREPDGTHTHCRATISGALAGRGQPAVPSDPCADDPRLRALPGAPSDPAAREMLFLTRILLLPPAN
jgi:hypothetical protein